MYSVLDGMPTVPDMVAKVAHNRQPGLGLTDHGVMSGAAELYAECKEAGIKAFPGEEFYVVKDVLDKEGKRYHLGLLALNSPAYEALLTLSSLSHERDRFYYRPRVDFADLAKMASDPKVAQGVVCLTGCWFGLLNQAIVDTFQANQKEHGKKARGVARSVGVMMVEMLQGWFPNTFIETQRHDIGRQDGVSEDEMVDLLWDISEETKAPIIATQDAHYIRMSDKPVHDIMKQIAYIGSDDAGFPGDGYHLSSTTWMKEHHSEAVWGSTLGVCQELLDRHELSIPVLDTYGYYVPKIGNDPQAWLMTTTALTLKRRKLGKEYLVRLADELKIIDGLGMAGYFRLIYEGTEFCKEKDIYVRARGSANGSLVCYLLGITSIDPIEWGLTFERFLSPDRKKPPDIDLDIEDTRRDDVVEFYRQKFQVVQIGTYSKLGENEFGRGSVLVQYLSAKRRELGDDFKAELGQVKYMEDVPDRDDRRLLHRLAEYQVRKAPGAHAAGFVVGTKTRPIRKQIPTMLIPSSGSVVTQFTMDDVERLGYLKLDLLGQRNLTTAKRTLELIGRDPAQGLNWIPNDDRHTMHQLRAGRTDGVFQLEGWTAANGCKEMRVKTTEDIIRVNALYRPATIKTGYKDLYLYNRGNPGEIEYPPHPAFEKHLSSTHGVAIFQEQVLNILRDIGIPYEELNQFLTALKLSNDKSVRARKIFAGHRKQFLKICREDWGMKQRSARECWDAISGFAGYGFNRAHAASYGLLGYQMAYLKTHNTLEFMGALLETTSGTPKEELYVREAKRLKITILGADVNRSGVVWAIDVNEPGIRRGLLSTKGVGAKAAMSIVENAPYANVEDLIERTDSRAVTGGKQWAKSRELKGVMEALRKGGALRSIGIDPYD